jgi:hypothetical protein
MSPLEDAWARIGVLLAMLQHVEHEMNVFLAFRFPDQSISLEEIAFLKKSKQKKTLGLILRELRKRIPTLPANDRLFSTFVKDRNRFVHRLFMERDYNINNAKNLSRILKFVDSLTVRSTVFLAGFHAINEIYAQEYHLTLPPVSFEWPPTLKWRTVVWKADQVR